MSAAGLVLIALGWSALVWGGASFLCRLKPSPRAAQAIWRAAAALMFAPFLAALVAPGLPVFEAAPLPDVPVLEPLLVQPAPEGQAAASAALRLPELGVVLMPRSSVAGPSASASGSSARCGCSVSRRAPCVSTGPSRTGPTRSTSRAGRTSA